MKLLTSIESVFLQLFQLCEHNPRTGREVDLISFELWPSEYDIVKEIRKERI